MQTILVVEDDRLLSEGIGFALDKAGFGVRRAASLGEAAQALEGTLDLVLLDINLPDGDGRQLLAQIRQHSELPVILLTARGGEGDMMAGFEAGCDDYVTKPFSLPVLVKKIQAVLKRANGQAGQLLLLGDITYDPKGRTLYKKGEEVRLTATELRLAEYFLAHRGQVLTREQLVERIWDTYESYVDENTLNVYIRRLREKLERDPKKPELIKTVFGIGYKWQDPER